MRISIDPVPFDPVQGYTIEVVGGTPPHHFDPLPAPPNPQGVTVQVNGNVATVTVPPGTPSGTTVQVAVSDSSPPPNGTLTTNVVV